MQHNVFFLVMATPMNNPLRHTLQQGHPPPRLSLEVQRLPQGSSLLVGSRVQSKPCKFPLEIGNNSRTHSVSFETCGFCVLKPLFCLYQGRRSSTFQSLVQMCWLYAVVIMQWNHGMQSVNAQCTLSNFISIVCFIFVLSKMVMLSKV